MTGDELRRLRSACPRALTHHLPKTPHDALQELASATPPDLPADYYGEAGWLAEFEARVAAELGHEAAVFLPTGTLAQLIALRIWCDERGCPNVAFHPTCHLELHESRAYALLHGLRAVPVGRATALMTVAEVRALADPLGAFVIELPQRELGAQLPEWDELCELAQAARGTGAAVHLDGARLWEAAPHYGRSHAEIAALFDSVYVSFYKGLGALAGAALAGDAAFIAQARVWQHRHGGRLVTLAPLALSARLNFERNLPRMTGYRARAREIAAGLGRLDGADIVPDPPHTNTFHVYVSGSRERLEDAAHAHARRTGTFVFGRLTPTAIPAVQKWEFVVGEATMALDTAVVIEAVRDVMRDANVAS